jgi:hypothetical protein
VATLPIPVKTADGQAELASRQRRVSQRHRTVLFLTDGKRSADEVRALARQAGSSDSCFSELIDLGMIKLPAAAAALRPPAALGLAAHVDIPLDPPALRAAFAAADEHEESLLPASRTLQPESVLTDSMLSDEPLSESMLADDDVGALRPLPADADRALEEARGILLRAVRSEAPLAGSLTILRLRRARSRSELAGLIDEVEARIVKPYRSLSAQQTLRRARELLFPPVYQPASGNG